MSTPAPLFHILSVVANIERHKLASGEPWLLLMDLEWPGDGLPSTAGATAVQTHMRFVRDLDPITFDAGDGLGPQVYQPFNFELGDLTIGNNGAIPDCKIQASNILRVLQGIIEQYAGIVGANVYLYVVNSTNPAGEPDLSLAFTVKKTDSDAKLVNFTLGASSPLRRLFPIHLYRPNFCGYQYNSPALQAATAAAIAAGTPLKDPPGIQCGYLGPLTSCSKTIDGPNGCLVHFPTSPMRGLFFPGIDSNGAAVAGVA